jgi:hypothetical protein
LILFGTEARLVHDKVSCQAKRFGRPQNRDPRINPNFNRFIATVITPLATSGDKQTVYLKRENQIVDLR